MQTWNKLSEKFALLSQREKWLISVGGLVGLFFILLTLLIDPIQNLSTIKKKQSDAESLQITKFETEIVSLKERLLVDPNAELEKQLSQLSDESQTLSLELSEFVGGLISPSDMAELLETVLDKSLTLKLVSLQSLPAESILSDAKESAGYFIHPVRLELTGKYFDIKDYLAALESMKVKYFWRSFQYEVEAYPKAKLVLVVYTLGTRQEFIGG
ncbi:MSHA biogenesis protein MshJ [Vibrio algarum]|uniref:MSHA biogenesis protein MshJ n=1 Tax=Vibrio algarum TaxID=3020714 RepID=A0ABT4YP74_9VIBR|nr:MSHA biogenesis protein MshJ [Vibrio sp. KJ40-1]MDB1122864.1 MSHA biogenesis protein MshJ [Vibrio sp. KJ40-1]